MQPLLQIRALHKHFGKIEVLKGVDLDVQEKEVVSIIGSSRGIEGASSSTGIV